MGNTKSKKVQREPDKFFERERWKEQKREEKKKKYVNPANKRVGVKEPPLTPTSALTPPPPVIKPAPANVRSYDDEVLDRMRYQLNNDSDAFLLNNILLSVQFFEDYEREIHNIKNNPINEREHTMDEEMVRRHKHVFFADRLQECVQEHISYQRRRDHTEPLIAPRLFIIYDNVEASEPGDTSDYCAVLDAPFYKLRIEDCKESGFVKLKKLEVLESSLSKENETMHKHQIHSDDSIYTDSEKESNDSDDYVKDRLGESLRLYEILTCRNPLHILNPNIPETIPHYKDSSDSDSDDNINFWDKAKAHDKHYQWKKERQRQLKERRRANTNNKKRGGVKEEKEMNKNIILPAKMQAERRRLVLEFFIPHFIAMARSSEKFDVIKQAVIYLEQAHRLCRLLMDEPAGDVTANEYLDVIRDKLTDCQRKLAKQVVYKLPPRMDSYSDRSGNSNLIRKHRPRYEHIINQDSPNDTTGIAPFTFVDVHVEDSSKEIKRLTVAFDPEESKL
ncbi:unnamed protein product, partial [Iphiclides podalirius]